MRLSKSASFLAAGAVLIGTPAAALTPGARSLTIEELNGLLATETEEEFDWDADTPEESAALWADAVAFEWDKAARGEEFESQKYPYAICNTGAKMSGYKRKLAIADALNTTDELHLRTIYNMEDFFCVYGQLFASVAAAVRGDDFIVQPILPSLKYMDSSVDAIRGMKEGADMIIEANLCAGVAMSSENNTLYDDIDAFSDWIIGKLVPVTIAQKLADAVSDAYYLTSEEYMNSTTDKDGAITERAELWKNLLDEYQESGVCAETYTQRLKWSLYRATDPDTSNSQVSIQFNNTGNSTQDQGCMLTLTLAIAAHPQVCSLDLRREVTTMNVIGQWLTQSELENERPFFDSGLDGTGQVVSVSDTGIDINNCYFLDPDQEPGGISDINEQARKVVQYVSYVDSEDYTYGHGTHVAGIIAGKRADGDGAADGAAPGAKLAFCDIGDSAGGLTLPPDSLLLEVGRPKSHIHSMSWGAEFNFYTTQARNFDQFVYENDDFLILVAAGNSGAGDAANSVGSPATAKNVIAVGSHHSWGSSNPPGSLGPAYVSDFSSRGPTSDGRMKPDVLAVGHAVLSAGALPDEYGECDPNKIPKANGKKEGLLSLQGTSMATPMAAGHAALIYQYFEEGYYPTGVKGEGEMITPSAALVKAIIMNGAQFMKGVDNGARGVTPVKPYDNNQGFGHVSLQNSVYLPGKTNVNIQVYDRESVTDGATNTYTVDIDTTNGCTKEDLSVTLVWNEEASTPGCVNCLLHDLDLTVEVGGVTYYPNGLQKPDRRNNAERVIVIVKNGDVATIKVEAYNLARFEQTYSVVATGCFGGVANQLYADGQCSAFECDNSKTWRLTIILLGIFIPLGVIIAAVVSHQLWKRKTRAKYGDDVFDRESEDENNKDIGGPNGGERIEEGVSVVRGTDAQDKDDSR